MSRIELVLIFYFSVDHTWKKARQFVLDVLDGHTGYVSAFYFSYGRIEGVPEGMLNEWNIARWFTVSYRTNVPPILNSSSVRYVPVALTCGIDV